MGNGSISIISDDGSVTETTQLDPGRQRDELFEIPDGFKPVANMMELMEGMMH